jgi:hypothetical protein
MLRERAGGEWRVTSVETREVNGEGMRLRNTPNDNTKGNAMSRLSMSYSNRRRGDDRSPATNRLEMHSGGETRINLPGDGGSDTSQLFALNS